MHTIMAIEYAQLAVSRQVHASQVTHPTIRIYEMTAVNTYFASCAMRRPVVSKRMVIVRFLDNAWPLQLNIYTLIHQSSLSAHLNSLS